MLLVLLFLAVGFVAFTNGANANFKGVASLYGSRTATFKQALLWGTTTTLAGSLTAMWLADGMLKKFSGRGLVPEELVQSPSFVTAAATGAALTSFLATRFGFPVSTTHALAGSLLGAGLAGSGTQVHFDALLTLFVLPLVFSPLVALCSSIVAYSLLRMTGKLPEGRNRTLDVLHFLSAGAASFARGLNDTPKMVALLLVAPNIDRTAAFGLVSIMIAVGALVDSRRVAETLAKKITEMNPAEGFVASLVTAGLVSTASLHSWPVSTTHVSVGALLGIGFVNRRAHWNKAAEILVAWLSTVPCGAVLSALVYWLICGSST